MRAQALTAEPRRRTGGAPARLLVPAGLLAVAAVGWWYAARMADDMTGGAMDEMSGGGMGAMAMDEPMSLAAFGLAWAAMMAAMMLPAVMPVVALYTRAAARGRAAPVPFFVGGYLGVWVVVALPAYVAWRALEEPLADGATWTGRLAGATLLAAAVWQLTPLKSACLRHCRSPLGFFLRHGRTLDGPAGALRAGFTHGAFCLGCCWTLFAVLVAVGTMSLAWMIGLTGLVLLEKHAPYGERIARGAAVGLAVLGAVLLADPATLTTLT